jgi:hypothetical protein
MHIVWGPFNLHHKLFFQDQNLNPSFPESQDEIPFKAGSLRHPKISISKCESFSKKIQNFQRILFKMIFIWFYFEFVKSNCLFGVQNLIQK